MAFKPEWDFAHVKAPSLRLAASRLEEILEDSSKVVICELILEEE